MQRGAAAGSAMLRSCETSLKMDEHHAERRERSRNKKREYDHRYATGDESGRGRRRRATVTGAGREASRDSAAAQSAGEPVEPRAHTETSGGVSGASAKRSAGAE